MKGSLGISIFFQILLDPFLDLMSDKDNYDFVEWFRQDQGIDKYEDSAVGLAAGAAILKFKNCGHNRFKPL